MTWESRWHPLREEWVVLAAHRQNRPWSGATVASGGAPPPPYVGDCYLCPGNARVGGARNPAYRDVFVFDNDHPCVGPDAPEPQPAPGFYRARRAAGIARVVCYTPRHDLSLSRLDHAGVVALLRCWQEQWRDLAARPGIAHILVFENRGEAVGVSNPHPHGQIYATDTVMRTTEVEAQASRRHLRESGRVLYQDILAAELQDARRVVCRRGSAVAFLPWFARWAYEAHVAPLATHPHIAALGDAEIDDLAAVLRELLVRFDNLWRMPFPYILALHQAPVDPAWHDGFHMHIELHPPLRKPGLLKYLAGPELGAGCFIADTAPEAKAEELRALPAIHHLDAGATHG